MADPGAPRRRAPGIAAAIVTLFAGGFAAGWLLRPAAAPGPPATHLIRGQSDRPWLFIDPLLECETVAEFQMLPELSATRRRVADVLEQRRRAGAITHASVYFRQLHDGPWFGVNEKEKYAPASLLKLPALIAVLKRAEREPGLLRRAVLFDDALDLNGMMAYPPPEPLRRGESYTVEELCRRMVRFSDNNAARMIVGLLAPGEIDQTLSALGLLPEFQSTGGKLSVKSASGLFRVLYNATYLGREMSETALEMLSRSSFREGLLGGIPPGTTASSKYGEAAVGGNLLELHEFAVVYEPNRPYLLGAMVQGTDFSAMTAVLRDLSRLVHADVDSAAHPFPHAPLAEP